VPVGELLDVVDRTVRTGSTTDGEGLPARDEIVVAHPLQPFDVRNFTTGALIRDRPWSFDAVALEGARALGAPRHDPSAFLSGRLPSTGSGIVELDSLVRFVQHPVRAFLRQRLGITVADYSDDVSDALAVELDQLEQWGVGDRLLAARLTGADADACVAAEVARGILPPGALADSILDRVGPTVEGLVSAAAALEAGAGARRSVEVNFELPDGRLLVGTVPGVTASLSATVVYSRVGPKHRLAAWARFLALTVAHPEADFEAATVGRKRAGARGRSSVTVARLAAFAGEPAAGQALALHHLVQLVELYDRGMREPLPLYCSASAAFAAASAAGKDPEAAARKAWESAWNYPREDSDREHVLVLGGILPFADVLEERPDQDEGGDGWNVDEPTRFGRYAHRLWDGLLACEEMSEQ
ncbi:MAG: exodeoxyribonuclease V subunit gamma, partial [Actinomycetota bacterium]|nr:exodeoxyribonuclease V subunit gamma [Actinomycetota bacterium]